MEEQRNKKKGQRVGQGLHISSLLLVLIIVSCAGETQEKYNRLQGRWQRPDGGYILEIKGIDPTGKIDARYFNPRPINISQAKVELAGNILKVFIELRDLNYPGATYNLGYNLEKDQLIGDYFQPVLQQHFDVVFTRIK